MEIKDAVASLKKNIKSMSVADIVRWIESNLKEKTFKLKIHDYEHGNVTETTCFEARKVACSRCQELGCPEGYIVSYTKIADWSKDRLEDLLENVFEVLKLCNYTSNKDGIFLAETFD